MKKLTGCVMVDFRKAFDIVDHKILLNKLKCYKCDENCLSWVCILSIQQNTARFFEQ